MQRHCRAGYEILGTSQSKILRLAAVIALTHHEWWDGTAIRKVLPARKSRAGRITAIADAFDALTSDRPYRRALSIHDARTTMIEERGTHFDPALLDLFLSADSTAPN